jgi:hypothetical protein
MIANQLRIGNLIKFSEDGTIFTVGSIEEKGFTVQNDEETTWIEAEEFEPIPLTEEWLLKFRFASNPYQDRYEKGVLHIECDKTKGYLQLWCEQLPQAIFIKYVHQLQNLYFALTGEELTYGGNK